jgi:hypothetical protein
MGLSIISTGNSMPFFRRPNNLRSVPICLLRGSLANVARGRDQSRLCAPVFPEVGWLFSDPSLDFPAFVATDDWIVGLGQSIIIII